MDNQSLDVLLLEPLRVGPRSWAAAFVLLLLAYVFILVSNAGLVVLVLLEPRLRQPMYLLLCNMSANDVLGATVMAPPVLRDLLRGAAPRPVRFGACAVQAFFVHLHASASHTVLMAMAFDRYVAICSPLRYAAVMSPAAVLRLTAAAWGSAAAPVLVLVALSVRLTRCRRRVSHPFCDNASLFKLSCESVLVNNVYGLSYSAALLAASVASVALTYLRIAAVCLRSRSRKLNGRALQTCATHLAVYVILLASAFIIVVLHRFPQLADHRKAAAVVGHVTLPALNALIYGLQIKEVRQRLAALFAKVTHS